MDDNINCEKKQNDELNKLKKQLDDSLKKIDELEQENKELKKKIINSEIIHWDDTCATIGKNEFGCF